MVRKLYDVARLFQGVSWAPYIPEIRTAHRFFHSPLFDSRDVVPPSCEEILRLVNSGSNCAGFVNFAVRCIQLYTPKWRAAPDEPAGVYEWQSAAEFCGRRVGGRDLSKLSGIHVLVRFNHAMRPLSDPERARGDNGHVALLVDGIVMSFGWPGMEVCPFSLARYPFPYDMTIDLAEYRHLGTAVQMLDPPLASHE